MKGGGDDLEEAVLRLVRGARRTCQQLGHVGYRFVGMADWLEVAIPRVNRILTDAARAAVNELTRPPPSDGGPRDEG